MVGGKPLIVWAVLKEDLLLAEFLVSQGHKVSGRDDDGFQAMHHAARIGHVQMIRFLYQVSITGFMSPSYSIIAFKVDDGT